MGVTYIKSNSSSTTTAIELGSDHSKSLEPTQESSSSSAGLSRKVEASRNGAMPTASIEAKQIVKNLLAKDDRYDAAIKAYRRRHRVSSLSEGKQKMNKPTTSTSMNVNVAATSAASERGRPSQVRAKEETNENASMKNSAATSSFPPRASQRLAEIIEMQKRKGRSMVLSGAKSSKSDTSEDVNLQLIDRTGMPVTLHNEVAKHVCINRDGASNTRPHRTPPRIQSDRSSTIMRRQQMQQTVNSISSRSARSRSLSVPRSVNSSSVIADVVTGGRIECAALSSKQSNNSNVSLTKSCSFSGRGEECEQILSRVDVRKARARQGRHRMVSGGNMLG